MGDSIYLGLDLSTQQLKATIIDQSLSVVHEENVSFDRDLPCYRTDGGVHKKEDGVTVTAPTLMWVESLDILLDKLKLSGIQLNRIIAVSGAGQQHGSVYWTQGAERVLRELNPQETLMVQLLDAFVIKDSPVWMDASTEEACQDRDASLGGPLEVAKVTGSSSYARFTGNQIRKIFKQRPDLYTKCERIALGSYAPIDVADGSGMNLLDIHTHKWDPRCLKITAPDLERRLGEPVMGGQVLGHVSPYMQARYGFSSKCKVAAFTGDNLASFAAMRLSPGDITVSMGTSDTVLLALQPPITPQAEGHVLCSPVHTDGTAMGMLCFSNGSLIREKVMEQTCGSWEAFSASLKKSTPGNHGRIGFYFQSTEIIPRGICGTWRFDADGTLVNNFDADTEIRAVVESQSLSRRLHAERLGLADQSKRKNARIIATGGASASAAILQVLADVFGLPVYTLKQANSAALGAAYIAYWSGEGRYLRGDTLFTLYHSFTDKLQHGAGPVLAATADAHAHEVYNKMLPVFEERENIVRRSRCE